jgi:hypothetical protein
LLLVAAAAYLGALRLSLRDPAAESGQGAPLDGALARR